MNRPIWAVWNPQGSGSKAGRRGSGAAGQRQKGEHSGAPRLADDGVRTAHRMSHMTYLCGNLLRAGHTGRLRAATWPDLGRHRTTFGLRNVGLAQESGERPAWGSSRGLVST